jgi:hypothetical protein
MDKIPKVSTRFIITCIDDNRLEKEEPGCQPVDGADPGFSPIVPTNIQILR